jgi:type II secretion system (T2SS) protein E
MARIGELLVAAKHLTHDQVQQALRAQVMWGGRLGTNLVELGYLDLETLSRALGRQHRLPAALSRHFDKADRELQRRLSAETAGRTLCIPLRELGARGQLSIALVAPLPPRELAAIARELEVAPQLVVPAIAAELRIRYHLERVYKIPRSTRYLRTAGKTIPPFPQFDIDEVEDSEVDLVLPTDTAELPAVPAPVAPDISAQINEALAETGGPAPAWGEIDDLSADVEEELDEDVAIPITVEDEPSGRERRTYVRTIADADADSAPQSLGRIAIKRIATSPGVPASTVMPVLQPSPATLGETTRAIRRSTDRDTVAELVLAAIDRYLPACEAALLMVVRGEVAIGWRGFSRAGATLPEIAVPLAEAGLVPWVVQRGLTVRLPATELRPIDQLLLVSLGRADGELAVVPMMILGQVMCVIAMVATTGGDLTSAESIAAAAGAAFARLMRNASR